MSCEPVAKIAVPHTTLAYAPLVSPVDCTLPIDWNFEIQKPNSPLITIQIQPLIATRPLERLMREQFLKPRIEPLALRELEAAVVPQDYLGSV